MVCKEFGIDDPSKHLLNRIDALEEPAFPLRRENAELPKVNVSSGEVLILTNITQGLSP